MTSPCKACAGMHGEDAENCDRCGGSGLEDRFMRIFNVTLNRLNDNMPPDGFDFADNACDLCGSVLNDALSTTRISPAWNNPESTDYVHDECLASYLTKYYGDGELLMLSDGRKEKPEPKKKRATRRAPQFVKSSSYSFQQWPIRYKCDNCKREFRTYKAFERHLTVKRGCVKLQRL